MTDQSSQYINDELASAQSLRTLKDTKVRTEDTGKDPSDTETLELIGTKYIRKRSRSEGDIQQDMSSDIHDMVSKNAYGKHRTSKSLDELTLIVSSLHTNMHTQRSFVQKRNQTI